MPALHTTQTHSDVHLVNSQQEILSTLRTCLTVELLFLTSNWLLKLQCVAVYCNYYHIKVRNYLNECKHGPLCHQNHSSLHCYPASVTVKQL